MNEHPEYVSQRGLEIAISLARPPFDLSLLPLHPAIFGDDTSGKHPFGNWKDRQKFHATAGEIVGWYKKYRFMNLGAVTGLVSGPRGIYVMDFDDMSDFEWWLNRFGGSPVQTRTGRGMQLFYDLDDVAVGNFAGLFGRKIDGRGEGGYVVVDGKHHSGRSYQRIGWTPDNFANMPKFNPEWIQQERKFERREVKSATLSDFDRAALWLASTPGAISGKAVTT